jgi:hypothetical protein
MITPQGMKKNLCLKQSGIALLLTLSFSSSKVLEFEELFIAMIL